MSALIAKIQQKGNLYMADQGNEQIQQKTMKSRYMSLKFHIK